MSAASPNYGDLKTDLRREIGSLPIGPAEYQRLDEWLADADIEIQGMWHDWKFLLANASFSSVSGTATYTLADLSLDTTLANWDRKSFVWDPTSDDYQILEELDYEEWRGTTRLGTVESDTPTDIVFKPNRDLVFYPTPNAVKTITADYWTIPARMSADADESLIPKQFRRLIVLRALLSALAFKGIEKPSPFIRVENRLQFEYEELLDRLEAQELPGMRYRRRSRSDQDITVVPV